MEKTLDDQMQPDSSRAGYVGRVLVVDDEKNIRSTVSMTLKSEGFTVDLAEDGDAADQTLTQTSPDLILLDVRMPGRGGLELLKIWRVQYPGTPIVLMSGEASITEALEGIKQGADDFLEKPFSRHRLVHSVVRAIEHVRLADQGKVKDQEAQIIGSSKALHKILADVNKIAPLKTRVLITGESGTGKDVIARAIHRNSARAGKPFIKVNCAAIPAGLIESELFGHIKGAFTGAISARKGVFEAADGGTLFLDEVGELSASAQAKMLRALQNGEISPVGSELVRQVDVRVIAATNRDLKEEIEVGHFREDLYYRLAVVCVESPPLRERADDVPLLVQHFSELIGKDNGIPAKEFAPAVMEILRSYQWPGNIRELRNAIERIMILSGPVVQKDDLPAEIVGGESAPLGGPAAANELEVLPWDQFKKTSERKYLIAVLQHCQGNISEAGRVLQVERSTIHKWLKAHQIAKHHYLS